MMNVGSDFAAELTEPGGSRKGEIPMFLPFRAVQVTSVVIALRHFTDMFLAPAAGNTRALSIPLPKILRQFRVERRAQRPAPAARRSQEFKGRSVLRILAILLGYLHAAHRRRGWG